MTLLGADPEQLEVAANRILAGADSYERARDQIGHWLRHMDWEGPEAERFHAAFVSQMRPQIDAAAAFLRQAASELRAQADAQTKASATPTVAHNLAAHVDRAVQAAQQVASLSSGPIALLGTLQLDTNEVAEWLRALFPLVGPVGIPINPLPLLDFVGVVSTATDLAGIADLALLRYLHNAVPGITGRLPSFGLERWLGGSLGSIVGTTAAGVGAGLGVLSLPGHFDEFGQAWEKIADSSHLQPEDAADLVDAGADIILDTSAMVGGFFTPPGLALSALGYGMKLGAQLDTPIIWAVDNIVYPGWLETKEFIGDVWSGVNQVGNTVFEGATRIGSTALGAAVDVGETLFSATTEMVGTTLGAAADVGETLLGAAADVVGDTVDTARDLVGWLNPFD